MTKSFPLTRNSVVALLLVAGCGVTAEDAGEQCDAVHDRQETCALEQGGNQIVVLACPYDYHECDNASDYYDHFEACLAMIDCGEFNQCVADAPSVCELGTPL